MNPNTGKYVILIGLIVVFVGIIIYFFSEKFQWLGRLPGDIRYETKNTRFYFPITTMLVISLVVNLIIYLVRKFC